MSTSLVYRLDELAEIVTGTTPKSSDTDSWGNYMPFLTPSDQLGGQREAVPARYLSKKASARLRKRVIPARSTNLTCIGSTIGKVTQAQVASVTNQQINTLVAFEGICDADYLYYLILLWSPTLKLEAAGSATPIINKSLLRSYAFTVHPIGEQRAIAEVLGALDDKIAVNTRLAQTADELAKTQFKDALQEPEEEVQLSSAADFINGKAFTKGATGTGRVVVRIAELNSGLTGSTVRNDLDVPDKHLVRAGDLLFAWSGSLTLHRWFREEAIVNQHIFKVIPNDSFPMWLINQLIGDKLDEFQRIAADKATTMGHIQRRHLDEGVVTPSKHRIAIMHDLMDGLWHRALAAEVENEWLLQIRDALLPQLMSGRLRVKDAEAVVSEAT